MNRNIKKFLCFLLSFVLIIGLTSGSVPGTKLAAYASESGDAVDDSVESEESVTEGDTEVQAQAVESEIVDTKTVESEIVDANTVESETVEEESGKSDTSENGIEDSNNTEEAVTVAEPENEAVSNEAAEISVLPESTTVKESASAATKESVSYLKASWDDENKKVIYTQNTAASATVLETTTSAWNEGWYVVDLEVLTINDRITVSGSVNLILADSTTLLADKGITVNDGSTLTIYAQTEGEERGKLVAACNDSAAAVGGNGDNSGSIIIHGGEVAVTGCNGGAGLGGGKDGNGGEVIIYGGIVTAAGDNGGAGIGGGKNGNGGEVTIYGGTVTATGANIIEEDTAVAGKFGTGIGAGFSDTAVLDNGSLTVPGQLTVYGGSSSENMTVITDYSTNRPQYMALKMNQTITAEDVTATYGDTGKAVSASTDGDGTLSYAVTSGDAVTVDASTGALTIVKAGTATVTVTASETTDYAKATKDVSVTISTKAMTVSADNVSVTADGQPHGITVNVTDPVSGATVKYGTEKGSYTLDASPTQTEAGTLTVYYQVTADNYTTYTGSATVTVNKKAISRKVTFKVVNGYWNDGSAKTKTVTLTGYEGETLKLSSSQIPSAGSNPSANYTTGSWDKEPNTTTAIETDTTYTYTYARKTVTRTVTFEVVNGTWNDGTSSDIDVSLTGYAGDTLTLSSGQIPSVGSNPSTNYKAGSWDVTPSTDTAITANTTYTYTYAKKEKVSWTVTFKVVNGSWNDKTTEKKTVTLTGYEGDTLKLSSDDIPAVGSNPSTNYKAGSWDEEPSTKTAITKNTTYTYTYAKKTTSSGSGSSGSSTSAKTGDNNMIWLWGALIAAAAAGLAFVIVKRRGKNE